MSIYDVVPITAEDYRRSAKRRLPRFLFDYIEGGANDEVTVARNVSDFDNYQLRQRVMRNVDDVSTETQLLGERATMPVALAPVGMAGMFARRGEAQAAKAAVKRGVPFTLSTVGICPVEEVVQHSGAPCWFQLYMLRDRDLIQNLLKRAEAAGCTTLVFTVDLPMPGMRLRDFRNGMLGGGALGAVSKIAQLATSPLWVFDVGIKGKPLNFGNLREVVPDPDDLTAYKSFIDAQFDRTVTWADIGWLRSIWPGKLLIKGVLEPDDALAAVDAGADGVVVSNHGGRQLDGVASTVSKLAATAQAVGERAEVFLDGGVRSGIDVVKALALGADGVLMGRAWVYAMASRGEGGVSDLLRVIQDEISVAMALMGVNRVSEISADLIESSTQHRPMELAQ
ncbi:MAG: FMN-dependent L-lactate dehydrogenase LldD [Congregibacter sp.]